MNHFIVALIIKKAPIKSDSEIDRPNRLSSFEILVFRDSASGHCRTHTDEDQGWSGGAKSVVSPLSALVAKLGQAAHGKGERHNWKSRPIDPKVSTYPKRSCLLTILMIAHLQYI